ncbi:hypothetical protein QC761_300400 [Podospora bellae-mahoneyi]|uniref:DUF7082 domain-containing protein n=1 Tax=Podospora bellae-mahoneyi TaxID=2093777 RepID=A0ABR0FLK0_9PEZI|nr:hypothetical protein QC761_300400 [Podospora bellae-mahoneyi]
MSATKFEEPAFKVYPSGYHPQRTIILEEQIESPETLTIRLEEEAAQNGGDLSGDCPPGLLPMSYKAQAAQMHGYGDSPYSQYSTQSFSTQQTENAASQLNQMAFAANSHATASQYLSGQTSPGLHLAVISSQPTVGSFGTRVSLKVSCQHDLLGAGGLSGSAPHVYVLFGSYRCKATVIKDGRDGSGSFSWTVTVEAPQFQSTSCRSLSNVPLTLLVEGSGGEGLARQDSCGVFSYQENQGGVSGGNVGAGVPGDSSPPEFGSPKNTGRSPVHHHRASPPHQHLDAQSKSTSPPAHQHSLPADAAPNPYGYPPAVSTTGTTGQQQDFNASANVSYSQNSNRMLSTSGFRTGLTLTDPYSRAPPMLRSPHHAGTWPGMFNSPLDSLRSPSTSLPHVSHTSITRPSLTSLQHSTTAATPQLVRTSTIGQSSSSANGGYPGYGAGLYQEKATLRLIGDLGSMAENWTAEEGAKKRRIVMFKKQQTGNVITVSFKPVAESERPHNSICVSCIWWEERQACFVTSVDTISLLEQLLYAPHKFPVDEKNRIRRNLEGYRPMTVSKSKHESEAFFGIIMGFGAPKPRNIEKDVKVFQWKDLDAALHKIFSKYSASTPATGQTLNSPRVRMATPASADHLGSPYPALSAAVSSGLAPDSISAASYVGAGHHHADPLTSPRTLTGGASSWPTYGAAKPLSPTIKTDSSSLRLSALPAVYDHRSTAAQGMASPYGIPGPSHHAVHHSQGAYGAHSGVPASQAQSRSWDNYSVTDGYGAQSSSTHGGVYGGGAYGDGAQRA